jgi:hypothetical protein
VQLNPVGLTTESHRYWLGFVPFTVSTKPCIPSITTPVQGLAPLHCSSAITSLVQVPDQLDNVRSRILNWEAVIDNR